MGKILLPAVLFGVGLVLVLVAAIFGFVVVPDIIDKKIKEEVRLENGTETWDKWAENPVPVYLRFFVFHVDNPTAIEDGVKPKLIERGPYVYREERQKIGVVIDEEKETVTYRQTIHYFFDEELSKMVDPTTGDETQLLEADIVNIVNLPFIAVSTSIFTKRLGVIGELLVNYLIGAGESFVRTGVTIKELIFEGFPINPLYGVVLAMLPEEERPPEFSDNKFAFYRHRNGSNDGEYVIRTGVSDSLNFGQIVSWEGSKYLDWWHAPENTTIPDHDKYCNMVNGTDGSIFRPFLDEDTTLHVYVTDICRSITFEHKGEDEHMGVKGLSFGFPDSFYTDPHYNDDNYCFCTQPEDDRLEGLCTQGVIRIFPCKKGAPIVTSSPHFRHGDETFVRHLEGINPTDEHDTVAVLEPNSGMLLKISKKVQINLEIQNFTQQFVPHFNHVPYMLFPAFWANEYVELDQKNIDDLKGKLLTPIKIVNIGRWTLIGVGIVVALAGVVIFVKRRS